MFEYILSIVYLLYKIILWYKLLFYGLYKRFMEYYINLYLTHCVKYDILFISDERENNNRELISNKVAVNSCQTLLSYANNY